jgi:hypothetical protein
MTADDVPGGIVCIQEALNFASVQQVFPNLTLQLCFSSISAFLLGFIPHRRCNHHIWHRFLAA